MWQVTFRSSETGFLWRAIPFNYKHTHQRSSSLFSRSCCMHKLFLSSSRWSLRRCRSARVICSSWFSALIWSSCRVWFWRVWSSWRRSVSAASRDVLRRSVSSCDSCSDRVLQPKLHYANFDKFRWKSRKQTIKRKIKNVTEKFWAFKPLRHVKMFATKSTTSSRTLSKSRCNGIWANLRKAKTGKPGRWNVKG